MKEETSSILNKEKPESFLDSSLCRYVLEQLIDKKDIKYYFKLILTDIIEKLKSLHSTEEITFDPDNIKKKINNNNIIDQNKIKKKDINKLKNDKDDLNSFKIQSIKKNNKIENHNKDIFISKYFKYLKEEDLKIYLSEYEKNSNNKNMRDYIDNIINKIKESPYLYDTKIFSKNFNDKPVINEYQENFIKISELINNIINNLLNNIKIVPYSIKCICKIIYKFIQKKYSNIDIIKKNAFIAKFFFYILFSKMLLNPCYLALINDFNLTVVQKNNLSTIIEILQKFVIGKLFTDDNKEGNYTPFNWMFIEKMPKLIEFFEMITNVKLPDFIEKLIDGNLNEDFNYDYFEENEDDIIIYNSICFSVDNIYTLVKNLEKGKEGILKAITNKDLKKIIEKLTNIEYINKLEDLANTKENDKFNKANTIQLKSININELDKKQGNLMENNIINKTLQTKKSLKFFLMLELEVNNKYKEVFNINNQKEYYSIPNKINKEDNELTEEKKNNYILNIVKNFLCAILYNYKLLNKDDFTEDTFSNISSIFNEMKNNMKVLNILIDKKIPSDWYIDTLLEYLKKLPNELINNDYEELFKQIEDDLKASINNQYFEDFSICIDKIKTLKDLNEYYEEAINILKDIEINLKTYKIINKITIPIEICYKKNKNFFNFNIIQNDNTISNDSKTHKNTIITKDETKIIYYTIQDFINNFPDIIKVSNKRKMSSFILLKEINFPEEINEYIQIICKTIQNKKNIKDETELKIIKNKIKDYIMEQLYPKIFPQEKDPADNMIYLNCNKVSWVEPKYLIKGKKNLIFGNFISDISEYFEKLDQQKCPRRKFIYLEEIFKSIYNLGIFNEEIMEGVDDEIQILEYGLIKAKPKKIKSNCDYMRLFIGNWKGKREDSHLTQLSITSSLVSKLDHSFFINITESEYYEKCKKNMLNYL